MDTHVHLVIQDLFLPKDIASKVCAGLHLPALEKILSRANSEPLQEASLEDWLCETFGVAGQAVAPVTLQADGVKPDAYYWLRADPVNLRILHDQLILQPAMPVGEDEAAQLCGALNDHFAGDGLHFVAPHPQRWYLRLDGDPHIATTSLAQVAGKNIHQFLPQGKESLRWHGILNEIQMLLFAHPVNEAREQRGEWGINGLWLWGGGHAGATLQCPFNRVCADSQLAAAFAAVAGTSYASLPGDDETGCIVHCIEGGHGEVLVVWDGLRSALQYGDLGGWRESLQHIEQRCAYPLLQALHGGLIEKITLDVLQGKSSRRFTLKRSDAWKFWRLARRLDSHALV
jgi:hypothetical protein